MLKRKKGFTQHHLWLKNGAGFTVMEAMVAVVILAVALLALLRVLPAGIKGSKLAEEMTIATMLAQKKMEETRAGTWAPTGDSGDFTSEGCPNFEYILNVTSVAPTDYLRELTVSVSWPSGASAQRTVSLKTYMAKLY